MQNISIFSRVRLEGVWKDDRDRDIASSAIRCGSTSLMGFDGTKETPFEINHLRTSLVSAGRHQHRYLKENGVSIWDEWADETAISARFTARNGAWPAPDGGTIDQISNVFGQIKANPDLRR